MTIVKTFVKTRILKVIVLGTVGLFLSPAHAADVPQTFTLDGRLFSNPQGTTPLADGTINLRLQVLDDDKVCILYEEQQTISTAASEGYFSVQVGSQIGSIKRTVLGDSGNDMTAVFSNMAPISGKAVADGLPCIVAPIGGKRRFVRMIIAPSSLGGAERTLSPDLTVDSVPNALIAERAESIQGLRSSSLLQVNTSGGSVLTQSNLESLFSNTSRFNAVTSLVDGTSATYMRSTSTTGAQLPVLATDPVAPPSPGLIWYNSTDQKIKLQTAGGPVTLANSGLSASGTPGKLAKFNATSSLADSLISDDGNEVTVASNLVSTPTALPTGSTVNLRTSNTHILSDIGGSTITLQNPAHGGLYNIVIADTAVRTYTFAGCTNSYYKPARGPTVNNTQTVFGILFVDAGAGTWNCYVTWSTGFATP